MGKTRAGVTAFVSYPLWKNSVGTVNPKNAKEQAHGHHGVRTAALTPRWRQRHAELEVHNQHKAANGGQQQRARKSAWSESGKPQM